MDQELPSSFIGNIGPVKQVREALNTNGRILLTGYTGCGKSVLVRMIANELNMDIILIESDTYHTLKQLEDAIVHSCKSKSIESFFFTPRKRVLFVDDFDIIASLLTKFPSAFSEWIKQPWAKTISIVCSGSNATKLQDLTRVGMNFINVKLSRPTKQECYHYFIEYSEIKGVNIDADHLIKMIEAHGHDVRAIQMNLYESFNKPSSKLLKQNQSNINNASEEDTSYFMEVREQGKPEIATLRRTFQDDSIFEVHERLLKKPHTLASIEDLIYGDSKMIGWTLHENIHKELHLCRTTNASDATAAIIKIFDAFAYAETIDHYVNSTMNWEIMAYAGVEMFGRPMAVLKSIPRKSHVGTLPFIFTSVMNKASRRAQFLRRLQEWTNRHGIDTYGSVHMEAMQTTAQYLAKYTSSKKNIHIVSSDNNSNNNSINNSIACTKDDIDVACRYGSDFGLLTASQCAAWKKHIKKSN
jgi:ABC-type dipeptide/oligopeptide/nickel transport system ATPase component